MDPARFPPSGDGLAQEHSGRTQVVADLAKKLEEEDYDHVIDRGLPLLPSLRSSDLPATTAADAARLIAKALARAGRADEAYKLAAEEREACRRSGNKQGEGRMLLTIADIRWPLEDFAEALQAAEGAQALFRDRASGGQPKMEAIALVAVAWIHLVGDDDIEQAAALGMSCARQAVALCQQCGYRQGEAEALHVLASAQSACNMAEDCLVSADGALDAFLEVKHQRAAAFEWLCMSQWYLENKQPEQAANAAEDALEAFQELRSPMEPDALMAMFKAYDALGRPQKAARAAKDALARFEDAGDRALEARSLEVLFRIHRASGRPRDALRASERSIALFRSLGDRAGEGRQLAGEASLHASAGVPDKAVEAGSEALPLLKASGETADLIELMKALVQAHSSLRNFEAARTVASELESHFEAEGDKVGGAEAWMCLCNVALAQDRPDDAVRAAGKAQSMFQAAGDPKGEAQGFQVMCEVHMRKEEYKAVIRAAEQGKALFRDLGDAFGETMMLYMLAHGAVSLAISDGARVEEQPGAARSSREALAKAAKASASAVRQARSLRDAGHLLACALCTQSQVDMLSGRPGEALTASDEGIVLFREAGDYASEASALLLSADALRATAQYREALEAATEALRLFRERDDEKGEARAQELLNFLQQFFRPAAPAPTASLAAAAQGAMRQVDFSAQGQQGAPAQATSVARPERERGAALDLSAGITEEAIKVKVLEIANRITGADDGEIEADTPLMEAGLTSNSAILLRDELSLEVPGINLPITLVFDYPSIAAMTELIVESSMKALK